jgi:16S rRNA (uracil1498-N3)-methyltransferase
MMIIISFAGFGNERKLIQKLLKHATNTRITPMRLHRIYYPFNASLGDTVFIENERAHYIRNVLRLKVCRKLRVFNHQQHEYLAEITAINKKNIELKLLESIQTIAPSKLDITLIQGLSKGERMDYTVQKATELGISKIVPIISEYCEVKLTDKRMQKKLNHWQNIALSACEQSFRADIPIITAPVNIDNYCQSPHCGILLEPNESRNIHDISKHKWGKFHIVVGPEGGWSAADLQKLKTTGLKGIHFGQRILRTETVAPTILAAIHSLWGDFI